MIDIAGDPRVLESLVDEGMEEEAGAARTKDTGRGLGESPEEDLVHAQNLHLHEKTPTQRRLPITPRKKYDGHTPHPAPGPVLHQDHALVRVLGPDPGLDASQADARIVPAPPIIRLSDAPELVNLSRNVCFDMNVTSTEPFVESLLSRLYFKNNGGPLLGFIKCY